jgi:hypothetical protein
MHRASLIIAAVLATAVAAPNAMAQPQSRLLGVPFGDKLALAQCPTNTDKAKAPCWIDRPFLYKPTGSKSGYVHLPNAEERPEWAAHAMFQISLDKDARVQELKVNTFSSQNKIQISESISKRFGRPIQDELRRSDVSWASWRSTEGYVEMRCKDECWIEFRTPTAQTARDAELAERAKVNAARPKAP